MYFRPCAIILLVQAGTSLASNFGADGRQYDISAARSSLGKPKNESVLLQKIPCSFVSSSMSGNGRTSNRLNEQQQQQPMDQSLISKIVQQQPKKISLTRVCMGGENNENNKNNKSIEEDSTNEEHKPKKEIAVCASIDLPFSASVAYDAFSDLSRQPSWSPMIRSVEYLDEIYDGDEVMVATTATNDVTYGKDNVSLPVTKWTMGASGLKFSWKAVSTSLERPNRIEWESVSGLKNMGKVDFVEVDDDTSKMTLSMKFLTPRIVSAMFRRSNKLASYVERAFIMETLIRFRDVITQEEGDLENKAMVSSSIE